VRQQDIAFTTRTLFQDVTTPGDDRLHGQARFLGESIGKDAQYPAVLRGRCGQDDEFLGIAGLCGDRGGKAGVGNHKGNDERTSKGNHVPGLLRDASRRDADWNLLSRSGTVVLNDAAGSPARCNGVHTTWKMTLGKA